jgi:acetylornithine deacetylase
MDLIENEPCLVLEKKGMEKPVFLNSMVLNCTSDGCKQYGTGNKGNSTIYEAIEDIHWFCTHIFPIEGDLMDPVEMTVLEIETLPLDNGKPCTCTFKVEIKYTSSYNRKEILNTVRNHVFCQFVVEQER